MIARAHDFDDVRPVAVLQSFKIIPKSERCTPADGPCSYTVTQQVTNDQRSPPLRDLVDKLVESCWCQMTLSTRDCSCVMYSTSMSNTHAAQVPTEVRVRVHS